MLQNEFNGWPTRILENNFVYLEYMAESPRIVRFNPIGRQNMFADLGNEPITTSFGNFYFRGGHRLWHSPEAMPRTYIPDNNDAVVRKIPNGVRIDQPSEAWTQISKSIEIILNPVKAQVILHHELRNDGPWEIEVAPWALTSFRLGGVAILPQPINDPDGLLPNRRISIWPYTKIDDSRLIWRNDCILMKGIAGHPSKIGYFNTYDWMAYWLDDTLFVKHFDLLSGGTFPDGGCNCETFCNDKFIELETLGRLGKLASGETVIHNETWDVYDSLDQPFIPTEIIKYLRT